MKTLALAAAALVVASPAAAQSVKMTGPRIEATVGWDHVVLDAAGESDGKSGVTFGGEAGYDFMAGPQIVLGAYAGIDGASTKYCDTEDGLSACLKAGRNITAGLRAGYAVGSSTLVYLKGGYSNGQVRLDATDTSVPNVRIRDRAHLRGFHVGAGTEVGLGHGLYGKVEYTYTNYESVENVADTDVDIGTSRHRVVIGAGLHF